MIDLFGASAPRIIRSTEQSSAGAKTIVFALRGAKSSAHRVELGGATDDIRFALSTLYEPRHAGRGDRREL